MREVDAASRDFPGNLQFLAFTDFREIKTLGKIEALNMISNAEYRGYSMYGHVGHKNHRATNHAQCTFATQHIKTTFSLSL